VQEGQAVLEIETDKATQEVVAPASGILHPIAAVGALLKEEHLLGYILADGESPPDLAPSSERLESKQKAAATISAASPAPRGFLKASPMAKRLAAEHGIDLARIRGSGPEGRIVEADVTAAIAHAQVTAPTVALAMERGAPVVKQRVPLTGMRRAIAERLRRSADTAVSITLTREVEADKLVAARRLASAGRSTTIPFDAYFTKMFAAALRERPELNSAMGSEELVIFAEVNMGVAVSVAEGLVVPVVRNADAMPLLLLGERIRELAARARAKELTNDDLLGGTCTLSNLGATGVDAFTPALNPPQSCILGVGRIQPRVVVRSGAPAVAETCVLSLTFDHRVTDGAPAAGVLETLARLMSDETYLAQLAKVS
jgi:pyruvate dehydrogenase E2 component (dihydrolipoamide acetyltransferase)